MHADGSPPAVTIAPAPKDRPPCAYLEARPPLRRLVQETRLDAPVDEVFRFFADAANLDLLTPAWMHFRILTPLPVTMKVGALIDYRIRLGPAPMGWKTRIDAWEPPHRFVDSQLEGPYRCWWHEHRFAPEGVGTRMIDQVWFTPAFGRLGQVVAGRAVETQLRRIFKYRGEVISRLFGRAAPNGQPDLSPVHHAPATSDLEQVPASNEDGSR